MRRILPILTGFLFLSLSSSAQTCFGSFAGPDISLPCTQPCTNFTAKIPEIKSTESYTVGSIPYNPYPYVTTAPRLIHPCSTGATSQDDKFFAASSLPFNFCFYGVSYNYAIVGTNGVISFNPADALLGNNYSMGNPIPFGGTGGQGSGVCPFPSGVNYPRPAIFGLYHDLLPDNPGSPTDKLEARVEGVAPCRKFIVSFNNVKLFRCQSVTATFEMVLYESSNIIEVYVQNKPFCADIDSDPIIGLQRTGSAPDFVAAPGRNLFSQAINNEAWQFTPNGASSLLDHVELWLNGAAVATGTLGALNSGLYDVDFGNICPPPGVNNYIVRGFYKTCNNNPAFFTIDDTVEINRVGPFFTNGTPTDVLCNGQSTGQVTFNPIGSSAPYVYSSDGGATYQVSNVFTGLAAGPHTFRVKDVNGCLNDTTIIISEPTAITNTLTKTDLSSCSPGNTGTITATYGGGTPPYQINIDGGAYAAATGSPQLFTGLGTGSHTICVKDNNNCIKCTSITIGQAPPVTLSLTETDVICNGGNTGTVTATFGGGVPPYFIKVDGGAYVPATGSPQTIPGLPAGNHTVCIKDNLNCEECATITVNEPTAVTNALTKTDVICNGGNTGTITATYGGGTPPYQVSVDGGAFVAATGSPQLFTGFTAGNHTICVKDANACQLCSSIQVNEPAAVSNTLTKTDVLCRGTNTGTIIVTYGGGVAPYFIQVDGGAYSPATGSPQTITGLFAGNHTVCVKDNNGCISCKNITIMEPASGLSVSATPTNGTCASNDGSITITAAGGTPAYQYSINNGVSYQASNIFTGIGVGNYTVMVKDLNGCTASNTTTVILNDTMRLELGPDTTICFGKSITLQPQTNALTDTFKWTPRTWLDYDTAKNPIATPQDTIKYYLTAKWGVCQRRDSITVNVLHKPVPFAGNDTLICYKTNAFLHGIATNLSGTVNYAWAPPDSLNTPNQATTIARMDTTRQFVLTVTDNYGCNFSVSDSMWVTMQPVVPAWAGNDTIAWANKPHQLHATGGLYYMWTPASPLDNPFIQDPKAVLTNDTYFTVVVTDGIGCQAEDGVFVKVYQGPEYYIPNVFSPNGDRLNDRFRAIPPGMKSTIYFRIYNRLGQLIFETNKWMEGWDGKYKGQNCDMGTYVWEIKGLDANGRVIELKGTVTLLR